MRRNIMVIGIVLLTIGVVFFAFPQQARNAETETIREWNLQEVVGTLEPQEDTFQAGLMNGLLYETMWFDFNLSSSDAIELTVSVYRQQGTVKDPISPFPLPLPVTSFKQRVYVSETGTYETYIKNVSEEQVTLEGNVIAKGEIVNYQTVYPYGFVGFFFLIAGAGTLIYGFRKSKAPVKSKSKIRRTS